MPNYFRNLEETLDQIEPDKVSASKKLKTWLGSHLRLVWTFIMMLILAMICLWISIEVSSQNQNRTIIESIADEEISSDRVLDEGSKQFQNIKSE